MEKHEQQSQHWKTFFPEAVTDSSKVEKDLNYYGAHFGIRALEYVVFIGTLLVLGLFGGAIFQIEEPGTAFYLFVAVLFLVGTVILHRTVHKRLIDALATGIALVGTISLIAGLFSSDKFTEKQVVGIVLVVLVMLIAVSRKNLLTILGVIASFWLLNWLFESRDTFIDNFKAIAMVFVLLLALLVYFEEYIISHYSKQAHFANYLKHGFFLALCSYFVVGFDTWSYSRQFQLNHTNWLVIGMYAELLILAVLLFVWQYRRLKQEKISLWMVFLLPLSLFLMGFFSVKIAFFLLAFLAFLFTRSIFGIITGALGLIYSVIYFYYELNWTLMQKSLVFIGLGVLYLGLFFLLNAKKPSHE
ncbi:DUF4401 domain-containing protein [Fluviicola sp.]|uniref:DUF4401 domain-containing protein n=1 Tax=Fluviicola sp. TaxID=1917219 RepID=UPI00262FF74E|nr:DUF4401 domain-containing protein [Fluviicola sp.]